MLFIIVVFLPPGKEKKSFYDVITKEIREVKFAKSAVSGVFFGVVVAFGAN